MHRTEGRSLPSTRLEALSRRLRLTPLFVTPRGLSLAIGGRAAKRVPSVDDLLGQHPSEEVHSLPGSSMLA